MKGDVGGREMREGGVGLMEEREEREKGGKEGRREQNRVKREEYGGRREREREGE